ncbi:hypothetical protein D3C72_1760930 [compost metagenome]
MNLTLSSAKAGAAATVAATAAEAITAWARRENERRERRIAVSLVVPVIAMAAGWQPRSDPGVPAAASALQADGNTAGRLRGKAQCRLLSPVRRGGAWPELFLDFW